MESNRWKRSLAGGAAGLAVILGLAACSSGEVPSPSPTSIESSRIEATVTSPEPSPSLSASPEATERPSLSLSPIAAPPLDEQVASGDDYEAAPPESGFAFASSDEACATLSIGDAYSTKISPANVDAVILESNEVWPGYGMMWCSWYSEAAAGQLIVQLNWNDFRLCGMDIVAYEDRRDIGYTSQSRESCGQPQGYVWVGEHREDGELVFSAAELDTAFEALMEESKALVWNVPGT